MHVRDVHRWIVAPLAGAIANLPRERVILLTALIALAGCSDAPLTGPDDHEPGPPHPSFSQQEPNTILVEPAPGTCGWTYSVTISADTVEAPPTGIPPDVITLEIDVHHANCGVDADSALVGLFPWLTLPSSVPYGVPLFDSIPPSQIFHSSTCSDPSSGCRPWNLDLWAVVGEGQGILSIPYETSGEAGIDSLFIWTYWVDGFEGPEVIVPIVTEAECPFFVQTPSDPLLTPEVINAMENAWNESTPGVGTALEHGYYIMEGDTFVPFWSNASPAQCFSLVDGGQIIALGGTSPSSPIRGHFHTHPNPPGPAPPSCWTNGRPGVFADGPSGPDIDAQFGSPWPGYVVDDERVYRIPEYYGSPVNPTGVITSFERNQCP